MRMEFLTNVVGGAAGDEWGVGGADSIYMIFALCTGRARGGAPRRMVRHALVFLTAHGVLHGAAGLYASVEVMCTLVGPVGGGFSPILCRSPLHWHLRAIQKIFFIVNNRCLNSAVCCWKFFLLLFGLSVHFLKGERG